MDLLGSSAMLIVNDGNLGVVRAGIPTSRGIYLDTFIELYIIDLLVSELLTIE